MLKVFVFKFSALLLAVIFAAPSVKTGTFRDANPHNRFNWQLNISYEPDSYDYYINYGIPPYSYVDVMTTYWENRGGPPPTIQDNTSQCSSMYGWGEEFLESYCSGEIHFTFEWIGYGSPPSTIDIETYSIAQAYALDEVDLEEVYTYNALGDTTFYDYINGYFVQWAEGTDEDTYNVVNGEVHLDWADYAIINGYGEDAWVAAWTCTTVQII